MSWSLYLDDEPVIDGHTYNLTPMWCLSGAVQHSTSELNGLSGHQLLGRTFPALERAIRYPQAFTALDPPNGWGDYEDFVETLFKVVRAAAANKTKTARWSG